MPRRRGSLSELKRGLRQMTPPRVAARMLSGGRHQTLKGWVRSYAKSVSTHRMADEAKLTAAQRAVPLSQRGRGGAAKKTASSRTNVYAAANQIPARNRATAARNAAAAKKTAGKKQQYVQGKGGLMQGSVTLPGADLTNYNAAKSGNAVIQSGEPNRRRW